MEQFFAADDVDEPRPFRRREHPGALLAHADALLHLHRPYYFDLHADKEEALLWVVHNRWDQGGTSRWKFKRRAWFEPVVLDEFDDVLDESELGKTP